MVVSRRRVPGVGRTGLLSTSAGVVSSAVIPLQSQSESSSLAAEERSEATPSRSGLDCRSAAKTGRINREKIASVRYLFNDAGFCQHKTGLLKPDFCGCSKSASHPKVCACPPKTRGVTVSRAHAFCAVFGQVEQDRQTVLYLSILAARSS